MKIGQLALTTGTPIETIRFYEREALLPAAPRTAGNYRVYGSSHVERLNFIRNCRALDMALEEIRVLLRFKDAPATSCTGVNDLLDEHIAHVAERIGELKSLERQLELLRDRCTEPHSTGDCGILQGLSTEPGSPVRNQTAHVHGTH